MDSTETKQTSGYTVEDRKLSQELDFGYASEVYNRTLDVMRQVAMMGYSHIASMQMTLPQKDRMKERLYTLSKEIITRKESNIEAIEMAIHYLSGYGTNQKRKHGLEVLNKMLINTKENGTML